MSWVILVLAWIVGSLQNVRLARIVARERLQRDACKWQATGYLVPVRYWHEGCWTRKYKLLWRRQADSALFTLETRA